MNKKADDSCPVCVENKDLKINLALLTDYTTLIQQHKQKISLLAIAYLTICQILFFASPINDINDSKETCSITKTISEDIKTTNIEKNCTTKQNVNTNADNTNADTNIEYILLMTSIGLIMTLLLTGILNHIKSLFIASIRKKNIFILLYNSWGEKYEKINKGRSNIWAIWGSIILFALIFIIICLQAFFLVSPSNVAVIIAVTIFVVLQMALISTYVFNNFIRLTKTFNIVNSKLKKSIEQHENNW